MNQFVLAHDAQRGFDFAAQQSATGRDYLLRFGANPAALTTLFVIADYRAAAPQLLSRARAVLFILGQIGPPWSWLRLFSILPDGVLNGGYELVARNRYRLFGQHDSCPLPSPETRARFIDV
jgi:predicted DCC family thiol-disulfide oxidoreductase YuxK